MTVVCLLDHSMRPLGRYHKQLALIGPEQTTRSTGGFDFDEYGLGETCSDEFLRGGKETMAVLVFSFLDFFPSIF